MQKLTSISTVLTAVLTAAVTFLTPPAQAGRIEPHPVSCYFFRGEKLELKQTCTYESWSWTGGGTSTLTWKDGVKTQGIWGLYGHGEKKACPKEGEMQIDGICGESYLRHPKTLKRLGSVEAERFRQTGNVVRCTQVKQNSVCWKF